MKTIIVSKISKFEWDMYRFNMTSEEVKEMYSKQGLNISKILGSHERQKKYLKTLLQTFLNAEVVKRDDLTKDIANSADIVISFGGDNHFQYVAKFVNSSLILGINSDPKLSEGFLTSVLADDIELVKNKLDKKEFYIEEWPRLSVSINDKKISEKIISDIFIGEENRMDMSRHIISHNNKTEEQKGSGLIITTGIGSTGWYNSACRYYFKGGNIFPKINKEARYILAEPYRGKLSKYDMLYGVLKEGEKLEIKSLNDSKGVLSLDSHKNFYLREGDTVSISFSDPLRVIKF